MSNFDLTNNTLTNGHMTSSGFMQIIPNPQPNVCPGCGKCRECGRPFHTAPSYPSYPYYPGWPPGWIPMPNPQIWC